MSAEKGPWKYIVLWLRFYYAIHFLKSGINYAVFGVIPDFSKAGLVGPYMHEMNEIGFYPLVKYLEIVLGSMLLFNVFVPVALSVMAGISFQIIYLNLFISPHPRQLFTGTQELILCGLLLLGYGKIFASLFQFRAQPGFPWDRGPNLVQASSENSSVLPPVAKDFIIVVLLAGVWTLVVMAFSTTMGTRPLRIYDWGPPVGALILTTVAMMVAQKKR